MNRLGCSRLSFPNWTFPGQPVSLIQYQLDQIAENEDGEDIDGKRSVSDSFQPFSLNSFRKAIEEVLRKAIDQFDQLNTEHTTYFKQVVKQLSKVVPDVNQIKAKFLILSKNNEIFNFDIFETLLEEALTEYQAVFEESLEILFQELAIAESFKSKLFRILSKQ